MKSRNEQELEAAQARFDAEVAALEQEIAEFQEEIAEQVSSSYGLPISEVRAVIDDAANSGKWEIVIQDMVRMRLTDGRLVRVH